MTTDATTEAPPSTISYDAALAYLGGPLFDAVKAEGYPVSTVGKTLQVYYPGTTAVLATFGIEESAGCTTYALRMHSSVAARKRPGTYTFNEEGRVNLPGLLANLKRERDAMRLELEAQRQQHLAEEAARVIASGNVARASAINANCSLPLPSGEGDGIPYLRSGLVEPSSTVDGHVLLRIRECAIDVPVDIGQRLAALLSDVGRITGKFS